MLSLFILVFLACIGIMALCSELYKASVLRCLRHNNKKKTEPVREETDEEKLEKLYEQIRQTITNRVNIEYPGAVWHWDTQTINTEHILSGCPMQIVIAGSTGKIKAHVRFEGTKLIRFAPVIVTAPPAQTDEEEQETEAETPSPAPDDAAASPAAPSEVVDVKPSAPTVSIPGYAPPSAEPSAPVDYVPAVIVPVVVETADDFLTDEDDWDDIDLPLEEESFSADDSEVIEAIDTSDDDAPDATEPDPGDAQEPSAATDTETFDAETWVEDHIFQIIDLMGEAQAQNRHELRLGSENGVPASHAEAISTVLSHTSGIKSAAVQDGNVKITF